MDRVKIQRDASSISNVACTALHPIPQLFAGWLNINASCFSFQTSDAAHPQQMPPCGCHIPPTSGAIHVRPRCSKRASPQDSRRQLQEGRALPITITTTTTTAPPTAPTRTTRPTSQEGGRLRGTDSPAHLPLTQRLSRMAAPSRPWAGT